VIDVEKRALRPFEQHFAAGLDGVEEIRRGVADEGPQPLGILPILLPDRSHVELGAEQFRLQGRDVSELCGELGPVEIAEPDGERAAHLVAVAGPDAAARRADRFTTGEAAVEQLVFGHVPGKYDVGPVAHEQLAGDRHAA
jgi:hypothetical protein